MVHMCSFVAFGPADKKKQISTNEQTNGRTGEQTDIITKNIHANCRPKSGSLYSPTILKNILCLFFSSKLVNLNETRLLIG